MHLDNEVKNDAMRRATARPQKIGNFAVTRIEDMDGMKFFFETPNNQQRRRSVGVDPRFRHRAVAARVQRSFVAGIGQRDPWRGGEVRSSARMMYGSYVAF